MGGFLATVGTLFILAGVILIFALEVITDIQIGIIACAFGFGFVLWGIAGVVWKLDTISFNITNIDHKNKNSQSAQKTAPTLSSPSKSNTQTTVAAKQSSNIDEGWMCECGRVNISACSTCTCGVNMRELQNRA